MVRAVYVLLLVSVWFPVSLNAQIKVKAGELREGDKMPDISFREAGDMTCNPTGKTRFSELKGKLIILDFWDKNCSSCVASFPKMQALQRAFKDSIQIILVNASDTKPEIIEHFKNRAVNAGNPFPEDLPQIVNAKLMRAIFPYKFSGTQVWIDPRGVIRILGGSPMNNHPQKIREVLAGKPINYVKLGKFFTTQDGPLCAKEKQGTPLSQSCILTYSSEYGASGGEVRNFIDSSNKTARYSYVNSSLLSLYNEALMPNFVGSWKNEIAHPYTTPWLNKYDLQVIDTLRYISDFVPKRDVDWLRSQYCYEQTIPANLSPKIRRQYILEDLNRYFGNLYGTQVQIEKRNRLCYLLVRTPAFDSVQIKSKSLNSNSSHFNKNGKQMTMWRGFNLSSLMQPYARFIFRAEVLPFLDETNFKERVDIGLPVPEEVNSLQELRKALQLYGLDIVIAEKELNMVVVKEN